MSAKKVKISPSILSADFGNLEQEIKAVDEAGAEYIHCDVMDGHFVPNITFGPFILKAVRKATDKVLDVHLMIYNPEKYIQDFRDAGADIITVHAEGCKDLPAVLDQIKESGAKVGVTVNPDFSEDLFLPYLEKIDMVLIMSVYAGFAGQKFIPEVMSKVTRVREEADKRNPDLDIEVDGGVNDKTVKQVLDAGANVIVAGSYIFGGEDYKQQIDSLRP